MAEFFETLVQRVRHWSILDQVHRIRWILVGFGVLILVSIPWGLRAEERGLEDATRVALADAGISADSIAFSGRSGTVTADLTNAELRTATVVVADISGVKDVDFVLLQPARTKTPAAAVIPSTTAAPADAAPSIVTSAPVRAAMLQATVADSRLELSGTLPTAEVLADLTRVGNFLYSPSLANSLVVDERVAYFESLDVAADLLTLLPQVSHGTIRIDDTGAHVEVTVESEAVAVALTQRLQDILGPDVAVAGTLSVSASSLPELDIAIEKGEVLRISGVVNNEGLQSAIRGALADVTGADQPDDLEVDPLTMETYATLRTPRLLRFLIAADDATLHIGDNEVSGSMVGGETWDAGKPRVTSPTWNLSRILAASLFGDPSLHLTLTVDSPRLESGEADLDLSYRRADLLELSLLRAGVEPDRMTVGIGDALGSSLRFLLAPADDLE